VTVPPEAHYDIALLDLPGIVSRAVRRTFGFKG